MLLRKRLLVFTGAVCGILVVIGCVMLACSSIPWGWIPLAAIMLGTTLAVLWSAVTTLVTK